MKTYACKKATPISNKKIENNNAYKKITKKTFKIKILDKKITYNRN